MPKQSEAQQVPMSPEQIETALKERDALATMLVPSKEPAGQAPTGAHPVREQEYPHPPMPPAPAVDIATVSTARDAKLAEVNAKVASIRRTEAELESQQKNAAALIEQMKVDRLRLVQEKESLQRDVIRLQQDIARQEALDLLGQQEADQARANSIVPGEQAAREVKALLEPLIDKTVLGLVKLKGLLATHGSALERIGKLRAPAGFTDETARVTYINTSIAGGKLLDELQAAINQHERVLLKASTLTSRTTLDVDPRGTFGSEADHSLVCEVQLALEQVSGMVQAKRFGSSIKVPTSKAYNEAPTTSAVDMFSERITSLLAQFADVAKRAPRPAGEIVISLVPKREKPRHEVMAELRGPSVEPFNPNQSRAEGVQE
jgi:hypothetical protein